MAYYQFTLPLSGGETFALIKQVTGKSCTVRQEVPGESIEVKTKFRMGKGSLPFVFYLRETGDGTEVMVSTEADTDMKNGTFHDTMAMFNASLLNAAGKISKQETIWDLPDKEWSDLIEDFTAAYPGFPLRSGKPTVTAAMLCDDGMAQESVSRGKNLSLGRAAVGGALFGNTGADLGGLSGTKQTRTQTRNVFAATVLFRVLYSNGRLIERTVKKTSREYAELMAKLI